MKCLSCKTLGIRSRLLQVFLLGLAVNLGISCKSDEPDPTPLDPSIAILGKWELVSFGSYPLMWGTEDGGFAEYLSNGKLIETHNGDTTIYTYGIDSSYLHTHLPHLSRGDTLESVFKYEFLSSKRLRTDYVIPKAEFPTAIYNKIK